jgi:hypothetical protein
MDITEKILTNKKYRKQIEVLSIETLRQIAEDPIIALEAARKGIAKEEPNKVNDIAYLQTLADGMQIVARIFIKRG